MSRLFLLLCFVLSCQFALAEGHGRFTQTPYKDQKAVFEFYFDEPEKINSALHWLRSYLNPLLEEPYGLAPEEVDIKVIIHGTEIVALAKKNYKKYKDAVERMRYYAGFGVEFKACGLAMADFGYSVKDFHDFVEVVPSAMTELVHWQNRGYGLITPRVLKKKFDIKDIR